jgi:hypothetical protein
LNTLRLGLITAPLGSEARFITDRRVTTRL